MLKKKLKFTNAEKYYHNYKSKNKKKTKDIKNYRENKNFRNYELERESNLGNEKIDINHLENLFTEKIFYQAMKSIPKQEKKLLYLCVYENRSLDYISRLLNMSRKEVIHTRDKAIKDFRGNIKNIKISKN